MIAILHNPRLEIKGEEIPEKILNYLKRSYGELDIIDDSEKVNIRDTDIFNDTELTPGAILRIRRYNAGLTQEALAEKVGVKKQNISAYENNRSVIGYKMACKLAKVLPGASVEELLKGE